jgi:NTP pyrophosphatase (non-canonical NTP hydrolase)
LRAFRDARNWLQYHTEENLAKSVVIEAAELLEIFQWGQDYKKISKKRIAEEAADVFIYLLQLADACGFDLLRAAHDKIDANEKKYPHPKMDMKP